MIGRNPPIREAGPSGPELIGFSKLTITTVSFVIYRHQQLDVKSQMNPVIQERLIAIALERRAAIERRELLATPTTTVPTRSVAKAGRKLARRIVRRLRHEHSMLHAGQPAGHRVVGCTDERTQLLLAKWLRHKANRK